MSVGLGVVFVSFGSAKPRFLVPYFLDFSVDVVFDLWISRLFRLRLGRYMNRNASPCSVSFFTRAYKALPSSLIALLRTL